MSATQQQPGNMWPCQSHETDNSGETNNGGSCHHGQCTGDSTYPLRIGTQGTGYLVVARGQQIQ